MKIHHHSAAELSRLLQAKELSAVEVVQDFLDRALAVEADLGAFITRTPEEALAAARAVDQKRSRGEKLHPLAGVPVAVKDNLCTRALPTTCASRILENYVPPYDATVIGKIKAAGMPILGKTNMDEFAMGSSTENSAFHLTRNPWDRTRVPGGSSGGSAVAVAAGMAPLALGSDTGGSIRQPASFCGLTGLRPTYGRVSRYGLIAFASSLDQIGPLAKTALDCALIMNLVAGFDPLDSTSLPGAVPDYTAALSRSVKNLKIGLIRHSAAAGFDPETSAAVAATAALLEKHGAVLGEASLPHADYGLSAYYLIAPSEASSNLGRYDGVRYGRCVPGDDIESMFSRTRQEGFGAEVKRRIMIGTYALSAGYYDAYYLQALKVRTMIRSDYEKAFREYDLLIGPATPGPAFGIGEKTDDPLQMYLSDICNITEALAGLPSLAFPGGMHSGGLPTGIQLTAPPLREDLLLQVAHFLEQEREPFPLSSGLRMPPGGEERP